MKKWIVLALTLFAAPAASYEIPPLTHLQVACYGNDYAIRTHVVDARSYACRKRRPNCFPSYVGATVIVDEVLVPSKKGLHDGDVLRVSFSVVQPVNAEVAKDNGQSGSLNFPDNHADEITDEFAKSQLVGRTLYLALSTKARSLLGGIPNRVNEPYRAEAYPSEDGEWLRETWASAECANERRKAEAFRRK